MCIRHCYLYPVQMDSLMYEYILFAKKLGVEQNCFHPDCTEYWESLSHFSRA